MGRTIRGEMRNRKLTQKYKDQRKMRQQKRSVNTDEEKNGTGKNPTSYQSREDQ